MSTDLEFGNEIILDQEALYSPTSNNKIDNDFIGFSFCGKHSSDFGIVRIINGGWLSNSLTPSFEDKIIQIPGGDESYYLNSFYQPKSFDISFGFENLTEAGLRGMRQWLNGRAFGKLIFDETPYKEYSAKISSSGILNFLCFEEQGDRIYKGTGSVTFICYQPFARCSKKFLNQYENEYGSIYTDQWNKGANLLEKQGIYDIIQPQVNSTSLIKLYNPGDLEADFCLEIEFLNDKIEEFELELKVNESLKSSMSFFEINRIGDDSKIRINTKTQLIEGLDSEGNITGNIYNNKIKNGIFFKIPIISSQEDNAYLTFGKEPAVLTYDYLYF